MDVKTLDWTKAPGRQARGFCFLPAHAASRKVRSFCRFPATAGCRKVRGFCRFPPAAGSRKVRGFCRFPPVAGSQKVRSLCLSQQILKSPDFSFPGGPWKYGESRIFIFSLRIPDSHARSSGDRKTCGPAPRHRTFPGRDVLFAVSAGLRVMGGACGIRSVIRALEAQFRPAASGALSGQCLPPFKDAPHYP